MQVRDVMTTAVIAVGPEAPFQQLIGLMLDHDVSGIPVVDRQGRPIGMVTEADLLSKEAYGDRRRLLYLVAAVWLGEESEWVEKAGGMTAGSVMTAPVRTVGMDEEVRRAAARLLTTRVKRLPVVDDNGRLVGIVSRVDILRLFHRPDRLISIDLERVLHDPLLVPGGHSTTGEVHDGVVELGGTVTRASHARIIATAVGELPGVIEVHNERVLVESEDVTTST
jgi:CBS domain-containing protein